MFLIFTEQMIAILIKIKLKQSLKNSNRVKNKQNSLQFNLKISNKKVLLLLYNNKTKQILKYLRALKLKEMTSLNKVFIILIYS